MTWEARHKGWVKVDPNLHVRLDHETLVGTSFDARRLDSFSSHGCHFIECSFSDSEIKSASFGSGAVTSVYERCTFDGAKLEIGSSGFARFIDCSFENIKIFDWMTYGVELIGCTFSGSMRGCVFDGRVPERYRQYTNRSTNEYLDNDFSRVKFSDVWFRGGIDLRRQNLPNGPNLVHIDDAANVLARVIRMLKESSSDDGRLASFITILQQYADEGQEQMLINLRDLPVRSRELARKVLTAEV